MLGQWVNVGVGIIMVNYDGVSKYVIVIGSGIKIGVNSVFVVLVQVGEGVMVVVGLVINWDVFVGFLAIVRLW